MQHGDELLIKDFFYELPEDKIAKFPLPVRDESKLLVYEKGKIKEDIYLHIDGYLPAESLLVFNNTKVVEARLLFAKNTGTVIEIFCLEPAQHYKDITTAMLQKEKVLWNCLVGGAKKWKEETLVKEIETGKHKLVLTAKKIEKKKDDYLIAFSWNDAELTFSEVLHYAGVIPLPPYLNRSAEESDKERYQTIYAAQQGSVAAPTAGLHFTQRLFDKLSAKGIRKDFVTLHVGAGTFKPVKSETLKQHEMHAEFIDVSKGFVENLLSNLTTCIIAVGTTSLRTVESLYWLGVKVKINAAVKPGELHLAQWEAYDLLKEDITAVEALSCLIAWLNKNNLQRLIIKTQIIIVPGYTLRIAKGLITNFHQPQSTLLLLIAAIAGENWKKIYNYALAHNYRFLSYGDGCLLYA